MREDSESDLNSFQNEKALVLEIEEELAAEIHELQYLITVEHS